MLKKNLGITAFLFALVILIIYSPKIDQTLASMPYDIATKRFYGESSIFCKIIYSIVSWITSLFILIPLLIILFNQKVIEKFPKINRKFALMILLSLIIGPGILVNTVFKDNWGRPRPYQVLRDGQVFKPVWQANVNKNRDNSFPSGHASIGFFLGVPLLILGYRKYALIAGLMGGSIVGLVRMLQGGHYFSDVFFAGIFVWISAEMVIYIINNFVNNSFE